MKCYVCYQNYDKCSGSSNSEPMKVFWYRKDAKAWVKLDKQTREFVEIEIK